MQLLNDNDVGTYSRYNNILYYYVQVTKLNIYIIYYL